LRQVERLIRANLQLTDIDKLPQQRKSGAINNGFKSSKKHLLNGFNITWGRESFFLFLASNLCITTPNATIAVDVSNTKQTADNAFFVSCPPRDPPMPRWCSATTPTNSSLTVLSLQLNKTI
jgi:hypothetical protein